MEFFSAASFEVVLFLVAALVYVVFSGWLLPQKQPAQKKQRQVTQVEPTFSGKESVLKCLRQGQLNDAVELLQQAPVDSDGHMPLGEVAARLLLVAAKSSDLQVAAATLKSLPGSLSPSALQVALIDARKETSVALVELAGLLCIPKTPRVLEAMVKTFASDAQRLQAIVEEAPTPMPASLAKAVLLASANSKDVDLVFQVFNKVSDSDAPALRSFVEKASAGDAKEMGKHCKAIRARGKAGDLIAATTTYDRLVKAGKGRSHQLVQSVVEACIDCKRVDKAEAYFMQAMTSGLVDGNVAGSMIRGYLADACLDKAEEVLETMFGMGKPLAQANYHAVLNAKVSASCDLERSWTVVQKMQSANMCPSAVTCSILLKGVINSKRQGEHIERILALMVQIEESMDDVLLGALVDVCVRAGQLKVLRNVLTQHHEQGRWLLTAPAYGSLIKAYGLTRNMEEVWWLWQEMRQRHVQPTAITLGCMVEALVSNRQTGAAWSLVRELCADETTKGLVNVVTYSTMLKGFGHEPAKMMSMYEEMKGLGIQCNAITYNTMLNCFAQCGGMNRVPELLDDMRHCQPPVEPDMITVSTLIKGYCSAGNIDQAIALFETMKSEKKHVPDEVMYNSLLNGCARHQRISEALWLVDDMKANGVVPSNYTLSMLVKLLGRCKRLSQAFNIVDSVSKEHGFKANIQVYTCLIQACFQNRQPQKAVDLLDRTLAEGLRPDQKTYTALVHGCVLAGQVSKAADMARRAYTDASSPAGIEPGAFDELLSKLGHDNPLAKDLIALSQQRPRKPELPASTGRGTTAVQKPAALGTWKKDARGRGNMRKQAQKECDSETMSTTTCGSGGRSRSASSRESCDA